jgi:hypothetical protein
VVAAVDWNVVTAAGAFILGASLGTLATIRIAKVVATFLTDLRDRHDKEAP